VHVGPIFRLALCTLGALLLLSPGGIGATAAAGRTDRISGGELLVFTAVSLKNALRDVIEVFEDRHPGIAIHLHTGASGLLARQIERGAPADLFLSAAPVEIDRLQEAGLLLHDSRGAFAGNRMVIAVARGVEPPATFHDLIEARFDRIAVGNPRTVPAGRYAAQALHSQEMYDTLASRLVPAENARQVLDYVVRGETAAGIVYRTDAHLAKRDVIIGPEPPADTHAPIIYEAAVPDAADNPNAALLFIDFLQSNRGQAVLSRFGFLPTPVQ
jgi:molybdate transport system substrate-binding protein